MSYLDRLQAIAAAPVVGEPSKGAKGGSDPFAGLAAGRFRGLPAACAAGLVRLSDMATPSITRPEVWMPIVSDALRLATDGWAAQALALGWTELDLWGCSPVCGGNAAHDGLAVWIDGRRPLLIDETSCMVEAGPGAHAIFNRRRSAGSVFLWDLGKRDVRG